MIVFGIAAIIAAVALLMFSAAEVLKALGIKVPEKEPELTEEQKRLIESEIQMNQRYADSMASLTGLANMGGMR